VHCLDDRRLHGRVDLRQRVGRGLGIERGDDLLPLDAPEVLEDVGEVRGCMVASC
jgi:hypothetical protein